MATFILVHGALHGGWCWDKVVHRLAQAGHRALAPDLPGMGANPVPPEDVTLEMTGTFIADLARSQVERAILVGHSLGGITISDAAERAPEAIAGLIYVSGVLLQTGAAAVDLLGSGELPEGLRYSDDGAVLTDDPLHARNRYYNGCDEVDVRNALLRLVPQPTRPYRDRLALTPGRFGTVPRAYIQCLHDNAIPFEVQQSLQSAMPCQPVFTMETGHSSFLQAPEMFSAHLIAAAKAFDRHVGPAE